MNSPVKLREARSGVQDDSWSFSFKRDRVVAFARWTPRGSEINREEIAMDLEREDHPFQVVGTAALGALPSRHWDVHMRQEAAALGILPSRHWHIHVRQEAESGARNREEVERRRSGV